MIDITNGNGSMVTLELTSNSPPNTHSNEVQLYLLIDQLLNENNSLTLKNESLNRELAKSRRTIGAFKANATRRKTTTVQA